MRLVQHGDEGEPGAGLLAAGDRELRGVRTRRRAVELQEQRLGRLVWISAAEETADGRLPLRRTGSARVA